MKQVILEGRVPVKVWTDEIEESARQQLINVSNMPFIFKHVAAMPDVHAGMGATIGSVIPTRGAVIPAAVGVDIGCGMQAVRTNLTKEDVKGWRYSKIKGEIEAAIPHGRSDNGGLNDIGAWPANKIPADVQEWWDIWGLDSPWCDEIRSRNPMLITRTVNTVRHLGTLGTGNHFIELCFDEKDRVWIVVHSGSRGVGNRIGSYFIKKAKELMRQYFIELPDPNLAYFPVGTKEFDDYIGMVEWAQDYALANRCIMMARVVDILADNIDKVVRAEENIDCHHNYVSIENHFKTNILVTRKGAISAKVTDLGIIPGSMGARSYIVRGKGKADSFKSAAHGAGRVMSRSEARKRFTRDDLIAQTRGITCRTDEDIIDEIPAAYKDIDVVMENQHDLVSILHELRQFINIKG